MLTKALTKNKTIEKLCFQSNNLKLPGILSNTKKITESLSRLTHLDLSYNKLPASGAKMLAKFLAENDTLTSLILTKNHITTKGANILLPLLKDNTSLQRLDLSQNWLNDGVADTVVDVLKNNSTLLTFDLSRNKSMTNGGKRTWRWNRETFRSERLPNTPDGGKARIVKGALFDTSSFQAIASCNHTCAVKTNCNNQGDAYGETIRKINALDVSEGKKIRYKVSTSQSLYYLFVHSYSILTPSNSLSLMTFPVVLQGRLSNERRE